MASALSNAIEFFKDFGLFDVVLPFLFVFTTVFAVLEKTLILGKDEKGQPKKNLNSMFAFVTALLVVVTNKVVNAINRALPNVVLLIVVSISFLLLIGVFMKTEELNFADKHKNWYKFFVLIMLVSVILIFLGAIQDDQGKSWLETLFDYVVDNAGNTVVTSIIFLVVVIGAIVFITRRPEPRGAR